ncbi:MAG: peptidoglycan DD-metalloendopeptidase family protein [Nitrospiraceae bacterium]|nr:peptidoglycan DD-metalloendopeptidase family protein [Nitrospiraceae bacterium]
MPAAASILLLLFLFFPQHASGAHSPEEEYKNIQEKMLEQKKRLSEAQEREHSILGEIDEVNERLGKIESELGGYKRDMGKTEAEIRSVDAEIEKTRAKLDRQKSWLKRKLRTIHRFGYSADTIVLLLSSSDVSQTMRMIKYLERITSHEHALLGNYRKDLEDLKIKQGRLQALRANLKVTADKVRTKEGELADQRRSKETILDSVRHEKAARQKVLAELKAASKRMLDIITESARTDTYTATGFARLKGRLLWPVDGRIAVPYGTHRDPQFDTPVFRNGVHIETAPSADAKAVFGGKVIYAEGFRGFGQLIIVNHGSGYNTLYGNLSEIFSKVGDIIRENQVIGKVGMSGVLNAPGLYFEIRYKGKPLDPAQWLRHRRK